MRKLFAGVPPMSQVPWRQLVRFILGEEVRRLLEEVRRQKVRRQEAEGEDAQVRLCISGALRESNHWPDKGAQVSAHRSSGTRSILFHIGPLSVWQRPMCARKMCDIG